jgi:hypothetical protein
MVGLLLLKQTYGPSDEQVCDSPAIPMTGIRSLRTIEETEKLTGRRIERAYVDKGYRGHSPPQPRRIFISGQKRRRSWRDQARASSDDLPSSS